MCSELEPQFPPLQIERYHVLKTVNVKICKVKITRKQHSSQLVNKQQLLLAVLF